MTPRQSPNSKESTAKRTVGPSQGHDEEGSDSLEVEAVVGKIVLTTFESAVEITAALSSLGFSECSA
jgi:hypothetical protein